MLTTFVIATIFLGICFLVEYIFKRRWDFSDYFLIYLLVVTSMLLQKIYGDEVDQYYNAPYLIEETCFIERDMGFGVSASTYVFPPKKGFDHTTINSDYTINEKGKSLIEKLGPADARIGLNKHVLSVDMWVDRLNNCSYIPGHPDQEACVKMFITSYLGARFNPSVTAWILFTEFSMYYAFQAVDTYYDIQACSKAITWHESCAQAYLDYCVRKKY